MDLDRKLPPDVTSVLNAAAMLDITEYELFQLAWLRWHGEAPDAAILEPFFVRYMFDRVVPPWVRHFARLVEEQFNAGRLDRHALGVARLRGSRRMVRRGMRYAVTAALVVTVVVVLAQVAAQVLKLSERCVFPPCY